MSTKTKLALAAVAVIAIVLGIAVGRCNPKPRALVDAGTLFVPPPPALDAGTVAVAPPVVDAGAKEAAAVVDAGEAEMPLVAPKERHPHHVDHDTRDTHDKIARVEPKHEEPKPEPKPEVHDAGPPPVVDAGPPPVVDAGVVAARSQHKDLELEKMPSAPLTIAYTDQLSSWLKLTQVRVFVDGKRVVDEHDDNGLDFTHTKQLYAGNVFPGTHQVRVESVYFGKSNGLFSYMEGYRFRVPQMAVVQVPDGKKLKVDAIAFDKGALEQWENRPAMKLDISLQ